MTNEQLDRACAEAMGWKQCAASGRWMVPGTPLEMNMPSEVPKFSTTIAAAWTLLDSLPHTLEIAVLRNGDGMAPKYQGKWRCLIEGAPDAGKRDHKTAPVAICLAFLAVKGLLHA